MTIGQTVRSTPMQWAKESKELDCAVKQMSWTPPWVKPSEEEPKKKVKGQGEALPKTAGVYNATEEPWCYVDRNEQVDDLLGRGPDGRIPAFWWTLNHRYNFDYEVHRLNVADSLYAAGPVEEEDVRRALLACDRAAKQFRYDFVKHAPDISVYMHALRAELHMRMVMPSVTGHSKARPYLTMARFETGSGGNKHWHGLSYGNGNPRIDRPNEKLVEGVAKDMASKEAAAEPSDASVVLSESEAGTEESEVGATVPAASNVGKGRRGQKVKGAVSTEGPGRGSGSGEPVTLDSKEKVFWEYFQNKVSEWNPCYGEQEDFRFSWDEEVGAHDVEVDLQGVSGTGGEDPHVRLDGFCPDVASTPHTVRLRGLLEKVLLEADGTPRAEVDLNPVRQLVASLVNNGQRHDRHSTHAPDFKKDACARGKPECPYCRYGFPHKLRPRNEGICLEEQEQEGRVAAWFPRNDQLTCSYEPHVLLANLGNVDWRPMLNLWAVVEYVTKYAMKAPGKSKPMRDVLIGAVDEVWNYTKEGEPMDLMRKCLQKVYTRTLGGRDYGIFEAVHLGLGLPLVFPLLRVDYLNTQGVRAVKSGKHLLDLAPGQPAVWDSKVDKFNKRLQLLRRARGKPRGLAVVTGGNVAEEETRMDDMIRDVSLYEFYSKYEFRGQCIFRRVAPIALQVTPGFSADCACVDHGLHEAFAQRCVIAFWRLMPTQRRHKLWAEKGSRSCDGRLLGSTRFDVPVEHAGFPDADRHLGIGDLYTAFSGTHRSEWQWIYDRSGDHKHTEKRFLRKDTAKPCYGWGFALVEMLLDPVLKAWVPQWVREQFERRNPDFEKIVDEVLREDGRRVQSNRGVIVTVRRRLRLSARKAARRAAAQGGGQKAAGAHESDGATDPSSGDDPAVSTDGSGDGGGAARDMLEDPQREPREAKAPWVQEPLPSADGFEGGDAEAEDEWARRNAEQRASAAGPAPAAAAAAPLPPAVAQLARFVSINPPGHKWHLENPITIDEAKAVEAQFQAWTKTVAGGDGEALTPDDMDAEQAFAYNIAEAKAEERATRARNGTLGKYRALRLIMTGTAGTGKSRTVRAIAGARRRRARHACIREQREVKEDEVRNACVLCAPTGCASFQMKQGATTLHQAFGLGGRNSSYCGPQRRRDDEVFVYRMRRLRAATLVVMDEFSMIGRQMMGKICFKANDMLGADRPDAGVHKSIGGKDVIQAGDPDQAQPVCDESANKEGAYTKQGGNAPRDDCGRLKPRPEGALDLGELVKLGIEFRREFDDAVLLTHRHRLADPKKLDGIPPEDHEAYVRDAETFADVTERMSDLSWSKTDHAWLSRRNRAEILKQPGGAEQLKAFDQAVVLMDTKKQRTGRPGEAQEKLDGADLKNLEELMKLARNTGVPVARFGAHHKKRGGEEAMRAELMPDDDFGLSSELLLCVGARVLLTRNLWTEAGLVNGAQGVVKGFVWPEGGDPASSNSTLRAPLCVIVEFEDVNLDEIRTTAEGEQTVLGRKLFSEASGFGNKCVPIFRVEGDSKVDSNVKRQQFPLTLAWALTHWKAQGMTLKRARVCLNESTAGRVGIGFVAVTRVGHPWRLVFDTPLPSYDAFEKAKYGEEFRARQRYKLGLRAKAAATIRRYGFYAKERWDPVDTALAERLLGHVAALAAAERAAAGRGGGRVAAGRDMDQDHYTWPWDTEEPPVAAVLEQAVDREVAAGMASREDCVRVTEYLQRDSQLPSVLEKMGCLIPRDLHPNHDNQKPKSKARAGATTPSAKLTAGKWSIDVDEERDVEVDGRSLRKGLFEFLLILLRHVCVELQLPIAVGSMGLGQKVLAARSPVQACVRVQGMATWKEEGGLRERFLQASEVMVPILLDTGPTVQDCVWMHLRPSHGAGLGAGAVPAAAAAAAAAPAALQGASKLTCDVYDRLRRDGRARMVIERLEALLPRPGGVRDGREVAVTMIEEVADESVGEVACLVLGLIVQRMAMVKGIAAAEPRAVGFAHAFRMRLRACLQYLRIEVDRHGVRDCLRAVIRNDPAETAEACTAVLKILASPPAADAVPVPVMDLAERALRTVQGQALQATRVMTWNICGDEKAAVAPAGFTASDKMTWLRAEVELLRPEILALQECPGEVALSCLVHLYTLVGTAKAHAGYVHLYVLTASDMKATRMESMRRGVPAVAAGVEVGAQTVVVVAAHLAANTRGALEGAQEGPEERRRQLCAIGDAVASSVQAPVLLLGDLNVRSDEGAELLEAGEWRDAAYHGKSLDPVRNNFKGDATRSGPKGCADQGGRFDRIWFRGAAWVQAYLVGTVRRIAEGRPYCLSDHYGVFGLVDVHACHARDGVQAVREKRRVDLGTLRDEEQARLKEAARLQEQASKEADWVAQQDASEKRIQELLRERRKAVKDRRDRRMQLREQVAGQASLFARGDAAERFGDRDGMLPLAPADHRIDAYVDLLGAGSQAVWKICCQGWPPLRSYPSVVGVVESTVQLLHRLLPVAVWLQEHRQQQQACPADCAVCAMSRCRDAMGQARDGMPVERLHAPKEELALMQLSPSPVEYLLGTLELLVQGEEALGRTAAGPMGRCITHVDRLFGFWVEVRKECSVCKHRTAEFLFQRSWQVSLADSTGHEATVTELFLASCAVVPDASLVCSSTRCRMALTPHRSQRWLATLPNILLLEVVGRDGRVGAEAASGPMPVRAEEQLVLAALCHPNLELAGVLYSWGERRSMCASRDPAGAFWMFGGRDAEPRCLGRDVTDVLAGRVALVAYQRPGGAADFESMSKKVVVGMAAGGGAAAAAGVATGREAEELAVRPVRKVQGAGGDGDGDADLSERERVIKRIVGDNLYFFGRMREESTFADVYFGHRALARACIVCMNARKVVWPVFERLCGDRAGYLSDRVLRFLFAEFPDFEIPAVGGRLFAHFVMQCSRAGVTAAEYDRVVELAKVRRESALSTAVGRRREAEAKRLVSRQRREQGEADAARQRRLEVARVGRENMEDLLLRGARGVGVSSARSASKSGLQAGAERATRAAAEAARNAGASSSSTSRGAGTGVTTSRKRGAGAAAGAGGAGRGRVDRGWTEQLVEWMPQNDIGHGLIAQLAIDLGEADAAERLNADWSVDWHGWTLLIGQIAERHTDRVQKLALYRGAAEIERIENEFMEQATGYVSTALRQFLVLSNQNSLIPGRTDSERQDELLSRYGLRKRYGQVWGRNDCCADSLLQLLIGHGVLNRTIDDRSRDGACLANRNALWDGPVELQPKAVDGTATWCAYLEVDRHAAPTVRFFLDYFRDQIVHVPAAGFEIVVYTRFDTEDERRPPLKLRICAQAHGGGVPLRLCMYNSSGDGIYGCHYDPMFATAAPRADRQAGVAGAGPPVSVDLAASVPVLQDVVGEAEQAAEQRSIDLSLQGGYVEDSDIEEVLMEDTVLEEAKRMSLISAGDADLQVALDRSMAGLSLSADTSGEQLRGALDVGTRSQAVEAEVEGPAPRPVAGAAAAQVGGGVVSGESGAGSGARRVERRVGPGMAFGEDRKLRRLRRAQTIAPTGQQGIDRAMSQGFFDCSDVDVSAYAVDRGRLDVSEAMGAATPLDPGGLATPVAAEADSDDGREAGGQFAGVDQAPCYSPAVRRARSLVEMPSSPALPPRPVARSGSAPEQAGTGSSNMPAGPSAYGPDLGRRRSARLEARNQAAGHGVRFGSAPGGAEGGGRARGRGAGRGGGRRS